MEQPHAENVPAEKVYQDIEIFKSRIVKTLRLQNSGENGQHSDLLKEGLQ